MSKDVNDIYKIASDKLLLGRKGVCLCKNGKGGDGCNKQVVELGGKKMK